MADSSQTIATAASASGIWEQIRLWGPIIIALISLAWSERTRRVTNRTALQLRGETVRLEEFRSGVKAPLIESLNSCEELSIKAEAIALSSKPIAEMQDDIKDLNLSMISALSKLETRLSDANESAFSEGTQWLDDFDDLQDEVLSAFNEAANPANLETKRKAALLKVKSAIGKLRSMTKSRIEQQIKMIIKEKP